MNGENAPKPELLAPVGDMEMALAAVHNGADAVYVGVPGFNARGRSKDFTFDELRELVRLCRLYGVKVHFALNVLVFENELRELARTLPRLAALGADAWIVQDVGLARMVRALCPDQPIHASTQMTLASAEAIAEMSDLGFEQAVLARENDLGQIRAIADALRERRLPVTLEVFVHGALCVAFSGQCLTSESFGGRSANRGQCAQACRLDYSLVVDGKEFDDGGRPYALSPRDLRALDELEELRDAGARTLKIEGRLKSPEYVAAAVRAYRSRLDTGKNSPRELSDLSRTFSRGFHSGWLRGLAHRRLVDGRTSAHVGEELGSVVRVERETVVVETKGFAAPGDGLLLAGPDGRTLGSRVHAVEPDGRTLRIRLAPGCDLRGVGPRWRAFVNDSPAAERALRNTWRDRERRRRVGARFLLTVRPGRPPELVARLDGGESAVAVGDAPCEPARSPASADRARDELGRLPEPWRAEEIRIDADPSLFLPNAVLRELKRRVLEELAEKRCRPPERRVASEEEIESLFVVPERPAAARTDEPPRLHLLVRSMEQIEAARGLELGSVTMDFEYGVSWREALEAIRALGQKAGLATPRVLLPGEQKRNRALGELSPDLLLVRNAGALELLRGCGVPAVGDFSLNAANSLSAEYWLDKGLERIVPSADLNGEQLLALLRSGRVDPARFEIPLLHRMPAFFMRHCVFASYLGKGERPGECGAPCRRHDVRIRDRMGETLYLGSDPFCRNTVYRERAQSSLRLLPEFLALGVRHFRAEALRETPEELRENVVLLLKALKGELAPEAALRALGAGDGAGVSEGRLFRADEWADRKKA